MKATSFSDLLRRDQVAQIEVPIIQRDYAQGRPNAEATRIRMRFSVFSIGALAGGGPVHLDFVYGHIEDGKLVPLDGQQRLTTLFLLHWYLGARAGVARRRPRHACQGSRTRPGGARVAFVRCSSRSAHFRCRGIGSVGLDHATRAGSASAWRHDPTIASMLVVLDAIHERFAAADCATAWQRLVDPRRPRDHVRLLADREHGSDRRPLHQDEFAREAADEFRESQSRIRRDGSRHFGRAATASSVRRSTISGRTSSGSCADPRRSSTICS